MTFNEQEKNKAIAEEYYQAGFNNEQLAQSEEITLANLSINPIDDYLSFLEISCNCLQKFGESKYSMDMARYLKRAFARYIIRNFPPNTVLEKVSFFGGSIKYNGGLFNELYQGIDFVLESERIHEDIIEQMESLYNSNNRVKKVFSHQPYPYIQIPHDDSCIHKFFLDEKIYNSIFERISEKDWNSLSNINQLRVQEIRKTINHVENDDDIIGKWKSNIFANLVPEKEIEKEIEEEEVNQDSEKPFSAIESALFIRFIFDELIGEQKWNVKGSKEIAEKIFKIPKATYEKKATESRNDLGGYQRAREYEASLEKISKLLKSFYHNEDEDEKSENFKHLKNIIEKVTREKDNARNKEIQKHKQKIPKSELKEQFNKV